MKRATTTRMQSTPHLDLPHNAVQQRLLSLDVFRGLTIAGMLLVNLPGTWSAIYTPFAHSEWHGCTAADLIFPFFLFIVGVTTHLSITSRRARGDSDGTIVRSILKRGAIIILLGLAFAAFPYTPDRLIHIRVPGVLQRIGATYILGALLTLRTTVKQQLLIIVALLFGYWFAMTLIPVPDSGILGALTLDTPPANLAAWVDRLLFGSHLWINAKTWDPEGAFSTIPAVSSVMFGILTAQWLFPKTQSPTPEQAGERQGDRRNLVVVTEVPLSLTRDPAAQSSPSNTPLTERLNALFAVGAIAIMLGLMWGWSFPINKSLWTSSYTLFTAGIAAVSLATCIWIVDIQRVTWWTRPFIIFGTNPIVAFLGSEVMARTIYSLIKVPFHGKTVSLQSAIYQTAFASWLPPKDASLLFAACVVLLWLGILTVLYRQRIFLKV
jgi:predicted acyltransferase